MYISKTDPTTLDGRTGPTAFAPGIGFTEADRALAYAADAFGRLTGYPTEDRLGRDGGAERARRTGAETDRALAYAENTFARMKGYRPDHRHHPDPCREVDRGRTAGGEVERAMAYAKDVFKRLKVFPAPGPLGRNLAPTAKPEGSSVERSFPMAKAFGRAAARLARLIRTTVVEPYARRRRRGIAFAQLEALDDRLPASIGLRRGDIEPTVDDMLALRRVAVSPPLTRSRPAEERRHLLLAA